MIEDVRARRQRRIRPNVHNRCHQAVGDIQVTVSLFTSLAHTATHANTNSNRLRATSQESAAAASQ